MHLAVRFLNTPLVAGAAEFVVTARRPNFKSPIPFS